jgi:3D (Asp-Asp-Asp) domain-containing protein
MQKEKRLELTCSRRLPTTALWGGLRARALAISILVLGASVSFGAGFGASGGGLRGEKAVKVTKEVTETVEPRVVYQLTRELPPGRVKKVQDGEPGTVTKTLEVTRVLNRVIKRRVLKEVRNSGQDTIILMGRGGFQQSRGAFYRRAVKRMLATAYDPSPATIGRGATGRTYTGRIARFGVVAVDPRVIPLGTLLYVEGYGFAIAADIGSAIKGNRIDLCYASKRKADAYGSKYVRVHILSAR